VMELLIICILLVILNGFCIYQCSKERQKLLDRIQSKSLLEYKTVCERKPKEKVNKESEVIEI